MEIKRVKRMHLFRGAPHVRNWSKYKKTVTGWTLCGRRRYLNSEGIFMPPATEDASKIDCPYCQCLMPAGRKMKPLPEQGPSDSAEPE